MTTTLITGANKSLGLETARRLIEAGHTVYAGMRDLASGDAARALGAHTVQLDATDQASVDAAIASLPALDVLVNNAGIPGTAWGVDDLDAAAMQAVLDTNVVGIIRVTQAALPLLRASAQPVIVNVASGVGWARYLLDETHDEFAVKTVPYAASKAGAQALAQAAAKELIPFGVRVSSIAPGPVDTPMASRTPDGLRRELTAPGVLGYASPEEIEARLRAVYLRHGEPPPPGLVQWTVMSFQPSDGANAESSTISVLNWK